MKDFRIVQAKTLLPVTSVAPIRGFLPPSVIVVGQNLNLTSEVIYNGIRVMEFLVSSSTRLVVRIPASQVGQEFRDIQIYTTVKKSGIAGVSFGINNPLGSVSGVERLAQSWLMVFMSTPGSDIFAPKSGGGARALVGRTTDKTGKGVTADLQLAIETTQSTILNLQASNPRIPLAERLLSSNLLDLQFDKDTATSSASVGITNVLGEQAGLNLG